MTLVGAEAGKNTKSVTTQIEKCDYPFSGVFLAANICVK